MRTAIFLLQLLVFQSGLYSSLEDHYHSRGMLCRKQLGEYKQQSHVNMHQLSSVREDLQTVLSLLMMFLDREKLKGIAERHKGMAWGLSSSTDDSAGTTPT